MQNYSVDPVVAWLITGLISALLVTVGAIGLLILKKITSISDSVAAQVVTNENNAEAHQVIFNKLQAHNDKLDDHSKILNHLKLIEDACIYSPLRNQNKADK